MANSTLTSEIRSPKLQQLLDDLRDNPKALVHFWIEAEETGTPLFEDYDPESRTWLVTFVYREIHPLKNVLLNEWIRNLDFPDKAMEKLDGTDIWYSSIRMIEGLRTQYNFAPNDSLVHKREETDWEARRSTWIVDPLNKTPLVRPDAPKLDRIRGEHDSVLSLPGAPAQRWIDTRADVAHGAVREHRFASQLLENERDIWLYIHPNVDTSKPVPFLIQFDGEIFDEVHRTPNVLDNLVAEGKVPPMAAVFVGSVDRGDELPCNADFVKMLKDELLPFVQQDLGIDIIGTKTVVNGVSYGGLASMFAGLTEPDTFGLVASQSGSFWWKPEPMQTSDILGGTDQFCWLPEQAASWPQSDIRIWMESGTLEGRGFMNVAPSLLDSNRHMRNVLKARGFDVCYQEYLGGHDSAHWRNSLGDALIHLLGNQG